MGVSLGMSETFGAYLLKNGAFCYRFNACF